jgi:hypothetical protein
MIMAPCDCKLCRVDQYSFDGNEAIKWGKWLMNSTWLEVDYCVGCVEHLFSTVREWMNS